MVFLAALTVIGCVGVIVASKAEKRDWWRVWLVGMFIAVTCFGIALMMASAVIAESLFSSGDRLNLTTIAAAVIGAVGLWRTWVSVHAAGERFPRGDWGS